MFSRKFLLVGSIRPAALKHSSASSWAPLCISARPRLLRYAGSSGRSVRALRYSTSAQCQSPRRRCTSPRAWWPSGDHGASSATRLASSHARARLSRPRAAVTTAMCVRPESGSMRQAANAASSAWSSRWHACAHWREHEVALHRLRFERDRPFRGALRIPRTADADVRQREVHQRVVVRRIARARRREHLDGLRVTPDLHQRRGARRARRRGRRAASLTATGAASCSRRGDRTRRSSSRTARSCGPSRTTVVCSDPRA